MTKEIIIDGVDVAGCYYMYDNEDLNYMCQNGIGTCICRENKNCYYKQLKRLEQENKELKTQIKNNKAVYQVELSTYNMECGNLLEENKSLIEENERLKEENEKIRNNKCVDCISHLISKNHKKALIKASKVLKTLQEIKEIAEQILNKNEFVYMNYRDVRQIIRLITKAEEE